MLWELYEEISYNKWIQIETLILCLDQTY